MVAIGCGGARERAQARSAKRKETRVTAMGSAGLARDVTVAGAGVLGLWQAFELARRGHRVRVREAASRSASAAASRYAGAMLAPYCEAEAAEAHVRDLGLAGLDLWRAAYPGVVARGSLVVAAPRDGSELARFARMTSGHRAVTGAQIAALEPDLGHRFARGLLFDGEAHLAPRPALEFLAREIERLGGELSFGDAVAEPLWRAAAAGEVVIDCRGMAARDAIGDLRGVRGEMLVLKSREVGLSRPVRLLHPRSPIYVVPWGEGHFMVGATVIEREDWAPVTVRSALDLLGTAYALCPAFAEAEIVELGAGVRPSLPDNVPRAVVEGRVIRVNGAYRHGFLLAPVMARVVADYLETGAVHPQLMRVAQHGQ